MKAVTPVIPGAEHLEQRLGKNQPEYDELPALPVQFQLPSSSAPVGFSTTADGVVTRWKFTDEERRRIADGADLFLTVLTFGQRFQPVMLALDPPEVKF
jgi:hypothetical protein